MNNQLDNQAQVPLVPGMKDKIFVLSMQRSGTSSAGDFLEQYGLKRAGCSFSNSKGWSQHWLNGNYDAIFKSPAFNKMQVFEDDPWWFPDFYKVVFHKTPNAKFILLTRDSDEWFKSMIRHSKGLTLGRANIHAKIYRREDDFAWLENNLEDFKDASPQIMMLYDKAIHYKQIYERHTREVEAFFKRHAPDALFSERLEDPDKWKKLQNWLGLPERKGVSLDVHAHKGRGEISIKHLQAFRSSKV